jgi:hypothetical protein
MSTFNSPFILRNEEIVRFVKYKLSLARLMANLRQIIYESLECYDMQTQEQTVPKLMRSTVF